MEFGDYGLESKLRVRRTPDVGERNSMLYHRLRE
jgi:hypothetical protein